MGATVVMAARREDELRRTLGMMRGNNHGIAPFDLAQGHAIVAWMCETVARFGRFDGLVHCAGTSYTMPIRATSEDLYRKIFALNQDAAYWLTKGFRHRLHHNDNGSIVIISSVAGMVGTAGLSAYSASKGAIISFARSVAIELVADKIRVNVISPALVATPLFEEYASGVPEENRKRKEAAHPMGIGIPEDVAHATIFLLSDASRWVTGINLPVDGGYTAQ